MQTSKKTLNYNKFALLLSEAITDLKDFEGKNNSLLLQPK